MRSLPAPESLTAVKVRNRVWVRCSELGTNPSVMPGTFDAIGIW